MTGPGLHQHVLSLQPSATIVAVSLNPMRTLPAVSIIETHSWPSNSQSRFEIENIVLSKRLDGVRQKYKVLLLPVIVPCYEEIRPVSENETVLHHCIRLAESWR